MKNLLLFLMMLSATVSLFAQRSVEGTVTDGKTGELLIGVTVQIKGTTVGTLSDINGKYRLVSDQLTESSSIVYSYIGYTKVEQTTGSLTVIDIKLYAEQTLLD